MAQISKATVLWGLLSLSGKTSDGKRRVITVPALAKHSGKSAAEVKAILEANEEALSRDDMGRAVGANVVTAARKLGLVIQSISAVRGSSYYRTFRDADKVLETFNLDVRSESDAATAFEGALKASGKIVCANISDLPDSVLVSVWHEDGVAG
jgi:hypothetical protein